MCRVVKIQHLTVNEVKLCSWDKDCVTSSVRVLISGNYNNHRMSECKVSEMENEMNSKHCYTKDQMIRNADSRLI